MYVLAVDKRREIPRAHSLWNLVELVASFLNPAPPLTSVVLPKAEPHHLEPASVVHLEYRRHQLRKWMFGEVPANVPESNLENWVVWSHFLVLEAVEGVAFSVQGFKRRGFHVLCEFPGDHKLLLRSEVVHEERERINTREFS